MQQKLNTVLAAHREHRVPSRAQIIRDQLMEEVRPVRALLKALTQQPWKGAADHPLLASLQQLNTLYERGKHALPVSSDLSLGRVWRKSLKDDDREKAFAAAEVGTLLNPRRSLRNGSVWIDHSLSFRSRESLFIPPTQWQNTRRAHYRRLHLPRDPAAFLEPLIERAKAGVQGVSMTAAEGILRVDDELHITPLQPSADDPKLSKLRAALVYLESNLDREFFPAYPGTTPDTGKARNLSRNFSGRVRRRFSTLKSRALRGFIVGVLKINIAVRLADLRRRRGAANLCIGRRLVGSTVEQSCGGVGAAADHCHRQHAPGGSRTAVESNTVECADRRQQRYAAAADPESS